VAEADALGYVAGYTCMNDVSARDLQNRTSQWMLGKAIDTFLPCGPWLVTADELPDPQALAIGLRLNGRELQSSSTAQMVFGVAELVASISRTMTLEPGDLIATGTPPGVGFARTPPVWLADGDVVEVEIEGIGTLTNPVRMERAST
ncbi:MAG: fumarylacetoacetate hydrolase family protein, partial [Actinomycetota bacterium]